MTTTQLHLFNALYLCIFAFVTVVTRARWQRVVGAAAGAMVAGLAALAAIAVGEKAGVWHFVIEWSPYFLLLLWVDFALCGFIFLLTWRIARRFGRRGLIITLMIAAVLGPLRDYRYMQQFPEWGSYGPEVAPFVAVSATYVLMGVLGHGVMRLIAGPARSDELARRAWE
jgi:hypothetical protein